ncbi:hypothetical protein BJY04DRAFT_218574 [Aspergillus karnatakaensis]|uniref:uncharacterized protein n=1 Tax=Aspergillus karnatakaensis TaxID=1810916 RepID=UPI003CCCDEF9
MASSSFPTRRRAWLACTTCRARKTRCDAARPKCSLCAAQKVDCVYQDSQQPKVDPTAKLLLDRIQLLEDRLFASPTLSGQHGNPAFYFSRPPTTLQDQGPEATRQIPVSLQHTANANHIFNWPIVRGLFSEAGQTQVLSIGATDIFFKPPEETAVGNPPPESWRLFQPGGPLILDVCIDIVHAYFDEVNTFYPLLSRSEMLRVLENVSLAERPLGRTYATEPPTRYCLILLVLCMGSFVRRGGNQARLEDSQPLEAFSQSMDCHLWEKASLLLGYVSSIRTLEAAQCTMIAGIYKGALGRVADSFHWAHITSVKCTTLAKVALCDSNESDTFPEAFRRLYWIAFIYENDYTSEISIGLPSGIALYEDVVPYPVQGASFDSASDAPSPTHPSLDHNDEIIAFQISTNAAIRRFLNRVHSIIYDTEYQGHTTRPDHTQWLFRITDEFS